MRATRWGLPFLGFLVTFVPAAPAGAYCILHTCKDVTAAEAAQSVGAEPYECERTNGCISEGHQLFWSSSCLTFGVSGLNASALNLEPEEFEAIVDDAFKVWEGVDCGGGKTPGLDVQSVGLVDSNGGFFCEEEPYANLSVWSLVTRWTRAGNALGYTSSTHNRRNGEIFDADVELNLNKIVSENSPRDYAVVLGRIIVHEAGHFLGLAHSSDKDAVMFASYDTYDLFTRELNQDDIDAICDLYPPEDAPKCSEPGYVEAALDEEACQEAALASDAAQGPTCAVARPGGNRPLGLWGLSAAAIAGAAWSRRRLWSRRCRGAAPLLRLGNDPRT